MGSASHVAGCPGTMSWYQMSRPSVHAMSPPVRRTTRTVATFGQSASASSVLRLSGTMRPPRTPSSAVITVRQSESRMRSLSDCGEKPPNTTEWVAPIRAQASIA